MIKPLILVVTVVHGIVLTQPTTPDPLDVRFCDVIASPATYSNRVIRVRGMWAEFPNIGLLYVSAFGHLSGWPYRMVMSRVTPAP